MSALSARFRAHKKAQAKLEDLATNSIYVNVIHYTCESLIKDDGSSPRVAAIAIRNLESGDTAAFSLHLECEKRRLTTTQSLSDQLLDELEKSLLCRYFSYLREHPREAWLHWKMRDQVFGFAAIEHRYDVLGGQPFVVDAVRKTDLSRLAEAIYGRNYTKVGTRHLTRLIELNRITSMDFIEGPEEPEYFKRGQFRALHNSTLRKVSIINEIYRRMEANTLVTDATWTDRYGMWALGPIESVRSHPYFAFVAGIFALIGLVAGVLQIIQFLF